MLEVCMCDGCESTGRQLKLFSRTHRELSSFIHWWLLLAGLFSPSNGSTQALNLYIALFCFWWCSMLVRAKNLRFSLISDKKTHTKKMSKVFHPCWEVGGENVWLKVVVTPSPISSSCVSSISDRFSLYSLFATHISQCHHHLSKPLCCMKAEK